MGYLFYLFILPLVDEWYEKHYEASGKKVDIDLYSYHPIAIILEIKIIIMYELTLPYYQTFFFPKNHFLLISWYQLVFVFSWIF